MMKTTVKCARLIGAVAVVLFLATQAPATTLTFFDGPTSGSLMDQTYGDNVTALDTNGHTYGSSPGGFTPNVDVSYSTTASVPIGGIANSAVHWHTWDSPSDGNVARLLGTAPGGAWSFTFTPSGSAVRLVSFELDPYNDNTGNTQQVDWEVRAGPVDTGTLLSSGTENILDTAPNLLVTTGAAAQTGVVTLRVDYVSGTNGMALDNIIIDQVPEPGTLALLAAGLMGLLAYAGRKRQ